ncbi:MAG: hypothetical protein J7642_03295 [Cyanobacteria bacterium SBC]|nr:hypothetical protein [Cyanobacteria bacterium SBC]
MGDGAVDLARLLRGVAFRPPRVASIPLETQTLQTVDRPLETQKDETQKDLTRSGVDLKLSLSIG